MCCSFFFFVYIIWKIKFHLSCGVNHKYQQVTLTLKQKEVLIFFSEFGPAQHHNPTRPKNKLRVLVINFYNTTQFNCEYNAGQTCTTQQQAAAQCSNPRQGGGGDHGAAQGPPRSLHCCGYCVGAEVASSSAATRGRCAASYGRAATTHGHPNSKVPLHLHRVQECMWYQAEARVGVPLLCRP
jgi:hypothetical protein